MTLAIQHKITTTAYPRRKSFQDLSGNKYGRLTVLRFAGSSARRETYFECQCECGTVVTIRSNSLKGGTCQSCGCYAIDCFVEQNYTHGMSYTKVYRTWIKIKGRTQNPNIDCYMNYGGRGIQMCDRWLHSFDAFYADMGDPPTPKHTIERINNNGNYCPENCKWATRQEQLANRRNSRYLTYQGETDLLLNWAKKCGMSDKTLTARLRYGWSIEKALTAPVQSHQKHLK